MYTYFQPLNTFSKWFQGQLLEKFKDDRITMSEVTATFYKISQSGFLTILNHFRNNVSRAFDSPINTFITDTITSMKEVYSQLLETVAAASYYYGSGTETILKRKALGMQIWRIPVGI